MNWPMIFNGVIGDIGIAAVWFYVGHCYAMAMHSCVTLVPSAAPAQVEDKRLPPAFAAFDQHLASVVFDARMAGPGMTTPRKAIMTKNGGKVLVHLTCDTDQFAAPEKDNRR